jgi:molecular chaperone DnaK (HSP70)
MNPFGIDFGTTNSVLAQWNGTEAEVLTIIRCGLRSERPPQSPR